MEIGNPPSLKAHHESTSVTRSARTACALRAGGGHSHTAQYVPALFSPRRACGGTLPSALLPPGRAPGLAYALAHCLQPCRLPDVRPAGCRRGAAHPPSSSAGPSGRGGNVPLLLSSCRDIFCVARLVRRIRSLSRHTVVAYISVRGQRAGVWGDICSPVLPPFLLRLHDGAVGHAASGAKALPLAGQGMFTP